MLFFLCKFYHFLKAVVLFFSFFFLKQNSTNCFHSSLNQFILLFLTRISFSKKKGKGRREKKTKLFFLTFLFRFLCVFFFTTICFTITLVLFIYYYYFLYYFYLCFSYPISFGQSSDNSNYRKIVLLLKIQQYSDREGWGLTKTERWKITKIGGEKKNVREESSK